MALESLDDDVVVAVKGLKGSVLPQCFSIHPLTYRVALFSNIITGRDITATFFPWNMFPGAY